MNWNTSAEDIGNQLRPDHSYFSTAYDFLISWRNGQTEFVLHTSGSTGQPKPITVTRSQLAASAHMTGKALGLGKGTRALVCLNTAYIAGLMMLVRGMELGWELTIIEPASNPILELEQPPRFDFVAMVPLQLRAILENPETKAQTEHLGKILLGGAPVSISLQEKILDLDIPVYQSYGMTETVSHVALKRLNGAGEHDSYTFLPDIRFGTDNRGCLFVSGKVTNHELVQTNDLVEISGNTFKWIGRADHVINSGGVKIVLDQVDASVAEIFHSFGLTNSFFCWHQNDEKLGQKLVLIVEGWITAASEKMLLDEIRKRVSSYETPKRIYFVGQFLKTPTNKVDKRGTVEQLFNS